MQRRAYPADVTAYMDVAGVDALIIPRNKADIPFNDAQQWNERTFVAPASVGGMPEMVVPAGFTPQGSRSASRSSGGPSTTRRCSRSPSPPSSSWMPGASRRRRLSSSSPPSPARRRSCRCPRRRRRFRRPSRRARTRSRLRSPSARGRSRVRQRSRAGKVCSSPGFRARTAGARPAGHSPSGEATAVEWALARVDGSRCRPIMKSGRVGKLTACASVSHLPATLSGAGSGKRWSLKTARTSLKKGTYRLLLRAVTGRERERGANHQREDRDLNAAPPRRPPSPHFWFAWPSL